jgi:hypothetical protein
MIDRLQIHYHFLQDVVVHHSQLATQPLDDSIELEAIPTQPAVSFRDLAMPQVREQNG